MQVDTEYESKSRCLPPNGTSWIELNQELAITKIVQAAGLVDSRKCKTPTVGGEKLFATKEGDPPPTEKWSYASILG